MGALDLLVSTRVAADLAVLVFVKGTVVLGAVALAARLLRRRSAALRHLTWSVGLTVLLALPAVSLLPGWSAEGGTLQYPAETGLLGMRALETPSATRPTAPSVPPAAEGAPSGMSTDVPVATLLLLAWWVGAIGVATGVLTDLGRAACLRLRCTRPAPDDPLRMAFEAERRTLGIRRPVDLLLSSEPGLAATFGALRPAVVLGTDVVGMPEAERRAVVIHELAHVRRGDFVQNLLTSLAMPLYWPNPLFWFARRRAALEREHACDDEVLNRGVASPLYARVLLDFAVARPALSPAMRNSVGFLPFSATRSRLGSILDPALDRRPAGSAAGFGAAVVLLVVAGTIGSLELLATEAGTGSTAELIAALEHEDADVRTRAARTLGRRGAEPGRLQIERLLDDPDSDVRLAAMSALEQLGSPLSLPAVARVLERRYDDGHGEHGFVLKLAMLTMGRIDSPEAARVLEQQLTRPVDPLRWLALETLLAMPTQGHRALGHLQRFAASDPSARNRRLALEALGVPRDF